ncbi:Histone acetyltransferase SAGA/ADA, catalytic subunit PCAF/GCN5 and related proteins [Phaffia rhodozyma]|uniref:Histone acetyltransferase SAGA/ADA, catalytic subunit PCAF/GCN5 and related proteins n=1 Tax=Phaffia rhodozyma TaxID=264483 RepID=A0A0F7SR44_PHARH|nr:Histone acetyltransferase SAGA/ADA, catalytic subunit PCAF/GCN5 and related proteins [Phaffia rhodozyma]
MPRSRHSTSTPLQTVVSKSPSPASSPGNYPPALAPAPPSPLVTRLRQDAMWAAVSQFCAMWLPTLGGIDWDPERIESDFDNTEDRYIAPMMTQLLTSLTLDKRIDKTNWVRHLRLQYLSRSPETNALGTEEEPRDWPELGLGDKLRAMHDLCEWQLVDCERFRGLVLNGEPDEEISWRIHPVGWDAKGNTFWLFDDSRLWVQHPIPPKPIKMVTRRIKVPREKVVARPRGRRQRGKAAAPTPAPALVESSPQKSSRTKRSAPLSPPAPAPPPVKKARSTRASLRASLTLPEWEEIPKEWLDPLQPEAGAGPEPSSSSSSAAAVKTEGSKQDATGSIDRRALKGTGLLSDDDESDLSEISDVEEKEEGEGVDWDWAEIEEEEEEEPDPRDEIVKMKETLAGFTEWEAVCVCRFDWENFPKQFENSEDTDEQMFYEYIVETVAPQVTAAFREIEHQKKLQEAIRNRKRSSRIQHLEESKAEQERLALARQSTEARMEKVRKEEAARALELREKQAVEKAREDRLKEREGRLWQREEAVRLAKERIEEEKAEEMRRREERYKIRIGELDPTQIEGGQNGSFSSSDLNPAGLETPRNGKGSSGKKKNSVFAKKAGVEIGGNKVEALLFPDPGQNKLGRRKLSASGSSNAGLGRKGSLNGSAKKKVSPTKKKDKDWTLRCEVCNLYAVNPLEFGPIICCGKCGEWQHEDCLDQRDAKQGIPKRNWKKVDFKCSSCQKKQAEKALRRKSSQQNIQGSPLSSPAQPGNTQTLPPSTMTSTSSLPSAPVPLLPNGISHPGFFSHSVMSPQQQLQLQQLQLQAQQAQVQHQPQRQQQRQHAVQHIGLPPYQSSSNGSYPVAVNNRVPYSSSPHTQPGVPTSHPQSHSQPHLQPQGQAQVHIRSPIYATSQVQPQPQSITHSQTSLQSQSQRPVSTGDVDVGGHQPYRGAESYSISSPSAQQQRPIHPQVTYPQTQVSNQGQNLQTQVQAQAQGQAQYSIPYTQYQQFPPAQSHLAGYQRSPQQLPHQVFQQQQYQQQHQRYQNVQQPQQQQHVAHNPTPPATAYHQQYPTHQTHNPQSNSFSHPLPMSQQSQPQMPAQGQVQPQLSHQSQQRPQ